MFSWCLYVSVLSGNKRNIHLDHLSGVYERMIYKCAARLLGTPKWCRTLSRSKIATVNIAKTEGMRGVGPPNPETDRPGWRRPLDRSYDLQLRETLSQFVPNPAEVQRARKSTDLDHIGRTPRAQRKMEKKVKGETGGANEDIQLKVFFSCRNMWKYNGIQN